MKPILFSLLLTGCTTAQYLTWDPSTGADSYVVKMTALPTPEQTGSITFIEQVSTSKALDDLQKGRGYKFSVNAVNKIGVSGPSNEVEFKP